MTGTAHPEPRLSRRDRALLVRLADGKLRGHRRARAEARLAAQPGAPRLLERQQRVRRALTEGPGPAPPPRYDRVEVPEPALRRSPAAHWFPRVAVAGALAAMAAVAVLALPAADDPSPVVQAADRAKQPATAPAPASDGAVLRASVDGVRFPDWSREFGWRVTGARQGRVGGREARTVFYEHHGHRLAYTILSGAPVKPPAGARTVRRAGLRIALSRDPAHGGHDIAVFQRGGRTCVVSGHVKRVSTLVRLAAWKGAVRS